MNEIVRGLQKLQKAGLTRHGWMAMPEGHSPQLQTLVAALPQVPESIPNGIVYDAAAMCRILGFVCACSDPAPKARAGETIIHYGGWDLATLRQSLVGRKYMCRELDQNGFHEKVCRAEPGYYRLKLRIPDSNYRNWETLVTQMRFMNEVIEPAPAIVAASALVAHLIETDKDLLDYDWCRCQDPLPKNNTVILTVRDSRVRFEEFPATKLAKRLWYASALRVAPMKS